MLRPVTMRQLSIIVPKNQLHNLLTYAGQDQSLHLVDVPKAGLPEGANPYEAAGILARSATLRNRLTVLSSTIGGHGTAQADSEAPLGNLEELANYLDKETGELEQIVRQHEDSVGRLQAELEKTRELSRFLSGLENAGVSLDAIAGKGFAAMLAGEAPRESIPALQRTIDTITYGNVIFAITGSQDKTETFLAIFPNAFLEEARQATTSLGSRLEPAWTDFPTSPAEAKKAIEFKLRELDESSKRLNNEREGVTKELGPHVKSLNTLSELLEARAKALSGSTTTQATYMLRAWVPEDKVQQFTEGAAKACEGLVSVHVEDGRGTMRTPHAEKPEHSNKHQEHNAEEAVKAPTLVRVPSWGGPLQSIINNFGIPSYSETNPLVFMIFSYPIIYGLMFGDFGQGPIFIVVGLLFLRLRKKGKKMSDIIQMLANGAELFILLGIGITVFGFVFGDFFGFESQSIFGFPSLFSPTAGALIGHIQNLKEFMVIVLVFGVGHITFGLGLSVYNKVRLREYSEAVFGPVCWIVFYLAGVYLVAEFAISKFDFSVILGNPLVLLVIVVPILLMGWKEGGLHSFEAVLSSASNTFSYLRIWALNIADFFFKFALFTSMGLLGAVIGNVLVMIIEGLIVFVQTLRLHWVEWFSKFYEGAGLSFAPYTEPTGWIVPA